MFLYVPANVEIAETFVAINNVSIGSADAATDKGAAVFPRVIVVLENHAKASLVHVVSSDRNAKSKSEATSLCNVSIEIYLRDGSNLKYVGTAKARRQRYLLSHVATTKSQKTLN